MNTVIGRPRKVFQVHHFQLNTRVAFGVKWEEMGNTFLPHYSEEIGVVWFVRVRTHFCGCLTRRSRLHCCSVLLESSVAEENGHSGHKGIQKISIYPSNRKMTTVVKTKSLLQNYAKAQK